MSHRHRRPRSGARGAAVLLLSGAALLGAGVGLAAGSGPQVVAEDLGAVPASAPDREPVRAVPASAVLPVLAPPAGDPAAAAPSPLGPAVPGPVPTGPGDPPALLPPGPRPGPGAPAGQDPRPAGLLPGPGVSAAEAPRPAGPLPVAPREPWTVSPIYPPAPVPAGPPAPVVPAALELPARGITAPVDAVGTGPDGGMVVPERVSTVGWWAPGALPGGRAGSAVLAGHVDSRTQGVGVLAVLPQLVEGEPVVVRGADGRAAEFRVTARREYGKHDLPREVFRRDGGPQLVLITCGGVFDPAAGSYESNIVVYAVPVAD
ncbi:class F sortase [Pseudonocardia sp. HH130630-07]|uniref:class F sortase n=1 Tax=Pseudonocardia sp. HH130630-07 TaxID=1690815 RepID=UPI0008150369|nr:class F sortase [Pseudonocardia sp. HH130630-07]ANY05899.1 hypothetical protein AFB00_05830 [Pseudonocardia sp. HH130630-07]